MKDTLLVKLENIKATVWITFNFPKWADNHTALTKNDSELADEMVRKCFYNTSIALGSSFKRRGKNIKRGLKIPYYAVPEVFAKGGVTKRPLHYHSGANVEESRLERFAAVMSIKWENICRYNFPRSEPKPLWMRKIDRVDPEYWNQPEKYSIENCLVDNAWARSRIIFTQF